MKHKIVLGIISAALIIQGCSSINKTGYKTVASMDQKTDPYGDVVSEKKHMVAVSLYRDMEYVKDKTIFKIIVENGGDNPLEISTSNISVIFRESGKNSTVKNIEIESLEDFIENIGHAFREAEKEKIRAILMKLKGAALSQTETSADMFALSFVRKVDNMEQEHERHEKLKHSMPEFLLQNQTIMPRKTATAIIPCDTHEITPETKGALEVTVSIDNEKHTFIFERVM